MAATKAEFEARTSLLKSLQEKSAALEIAIEDEKEAIASSDAKLVQIRTSVSNLQDSEATI